ncbi:MAG: hypothetical protein ABIJ22_04235 [Patescibacteria group bacterium]
MSKKRCTQCWSLNTTKKGVRRGKQRFWCKDCITKFEITQKSVNKYRNEKLWDRYVFGKQTLRELSEEGGQYEEGSWNGR